MQRSIYSDFDDAVAAHAVQFGAIRVLTDIFWAFLSNKLF